MSAQRLPASYRTASSRPPAIRRRIFRALTAAAAALAFFSSAQAQTVSWTDTTGYWDVGGNWSNGTGPAAGNDVVIAVSGGPYTITYRESSLTIGSLTVTNNNFDMTGGTLEVSGDATGGYNNTGGATTLSGGTLRLDNGASNSISTLDLTSGGTLSGGGTVTVGTLNFSGGTMGENTVGFTGGTTTVSGATTFDGTQEENVYYGRTLNLNGGATWTNSTGGVINLYTGGDATTSTIKIASGTTFTDQGLSNTSTRYLGYNADGIIDNAGTYLRSYVVSGVQSALGTTQVNATFNNTGTVEVAGGILNFVTGGSSTGTLQADAAGTLAFQGGTFNVTGGSLTDNGTLLVSGGTLNIGSG